MKKRSLYVSIILSIISIILTLFINTSIAKEYLRSYGKTQALFGIKEVLQFSYQYYVTILGIIALILALTNIKTSLKRNQLIIAIVLSIIAIILVFIRIWRIFI